MSLDPASDSGTLGDGKTNDNTPTLNGTAPANSTVNIYDGGNLIGTATADANGNWSFTPTTPLLDGTHNLCHLHRCVR